MDQGLVEMTSSSALMLLSVWVDYNLCMSLVLALGPPEKLTENTLGYV